MANLPKDMYQPETTNHNAAHAILMMTANNTEDLEFFYPYYRFIEAGYKVDVITPNGGEFKAKHGLGLKQTKKISQVAAEDYELLYIPGGQAPEELKKYAEAIALTQKFFADGNIISSICHGPQVLAAAGIIKGHKIAAWPEVEAEVLEAGAIYIDQETVADGLFVTARWPGDLPMHMKETLAQLSKNKKSRTASHAA